MRHIYRLVMFVVLGTIISFGCDPKNQNKRNQPDDAVIFSNGNSEVTPPSGMTPDQLAIMHTGLKSCNGCHAKDRPAIPHDQKADCAGCHSFPAFKSSLNAVSHEPRPASCVGCHEKDRPALPHDAKQDCVGCHDFPKFAGVITSFNHSPTPASCVSCHEKDRPAAPHIANKDCVGCHAFPDFKRVAFSHIPKPAVCEDCHTRPTAVGARAYPNQGPPAGFLANDPKAIGGKHYVGKDCAACHRTPDEGATAFTFNHSTPKAEFCLPCHFNQGRAEHANDNRGVVLRDFGNCFSCHKNFDVNATRNFGRGN